MALPSDLNTRWFQAFTTDAGGTPALNVVLAGGTVAGPLLFPNGSASAPSISFVNGPTDGFYLAAVGDVRLALGGSLGFGFQAGTFTMNSNSAKIAMSTSGDLSFDRTAAGSVAVTNANGQQYGMKQLTELTTINVAASTDTAISIPINTIVIGVSVRVTVTIPTSVTFTVTGATSGTAFQTGATVATAAGTTDVGTKNCPFLNTAAQLVRITPNVNPGTNAGRVRVTVHYLDITAPTS